MDNWKPDKDNRIGYAKEMLEKKGEMLEKKGGKADADIMEDVRKIMSEAKKYNPCLKYSIKRLSEVDNLPDNNEVLFVKFTEDNYIAVVGAGITDCKKKDTDMNSSPGKILKECEKKWGKNDNTIIILISQGITQRGKAGLNNVLKCRNGIEMYLGEELLKEYLIIDEYSHKNYKQEYWEKVKKNKYELASSES